MPNDASVVTSPRIAVIGGGISGLVAARELALAGARVTLVESETRLGGRIWQQSVGPTSIDVGAEAFATRGGTVAAYLAVLGLEESIVQPRTLGSWVIAEGRAVRLPAAGTLGIPVKPLGRDAIRALGLSGSLRAAIEPLLPRRRAASARSLGELVRSRLGDRVFERLVRPVVLGVHSADPDSLPLSRFPELVDALSHNPSLLRAARRIRRQASAAGGAVAGLRGGMGTLIQTLDAGLAELGVHRLHGIPVAELHHDDSAWHLRDSAGQSLADVDAVLLAVSEREARRMIGAEPPAKPDTEVEVVALLVDDATLDRAPRGTGALVADPLPRDREGIHAKALTHATAKWPWLAEAVGPGRHVVRLSYGSSVARPATEGLDSAEVVRLAIEDASAILGTRLREDSVVEMRRAHWAFTTAGAGVRQPAQVRADILRSAQLPATSSVQFAGEWVSGTGLASVIPGARQAARSLLDVHGIPAFDATGLSPQRSTTDHERLTRRTEQGISAA